ncbi:MAG: hypothetical protein IJ685_07815 [Selenomonadaceae bacterium]|nr:hypothetical protein [Selenomonadaceae bacterium]
MMWKKFFAVMFAAFFLNSSAFAQVVTVQGSGISEDAAIKDAKRAAVETVIGTLIKSRSLMVDFRFVSDAIQSRTQGYVTGCEVIDKKSEGGLITVTAKVDVADAPGSALMNDAELVMSLNDPRLGIVVEYYGDDGGELYKKYPVQVEAAIREELLKRGFTHLVDARGEVDYVVIGRLTVGKAQEIKLPNWRNISGDDFKMLDTGLSRSTATIDCKIKKFDTDEVIGEFHADGNGSDATGNEISAQAVRALATSTAEQVRGLLSREASKVFSSVKIIAHCNDGQKILKLEEFLRQTQGVNNVYVRTFRDGKCIVDVDTGMTPQDLYRALTAVTGEKFPVKLSGFSSITLEISL